MIKPFSGMDKEAKMIAIVPAAAGDRTLFAQGPAPLPFLSLPLFSPTLLHLFLVCFLLQRLQVPFKELYLGGVLTLVTPLFWPSQGGERRNHLTQFAWRAPHVPTCVGLEIPSGTAGSLQETPPHRTSK